MELSTLLDTYFIDTLPNKRRGEDSILFEMNLERNLTNLCNDINNRTLQPTAYTFVSKNPKPREVFACDMGSRICQHYIEKRIRPILESALIESTFNNRKGKGTTAAVNHLIEDIYDVSEGFNNDNCWIIKVDMRGYFPNANQDIAYAQLEKLILDNYTGSDIDDLLYLLKVSIFSYPTEHCYKKSTPEEWQLIEPSKSLFHKDPGIGGAIGHLIWQCAMTYYINDVCHWLVDDCGLHITVYMDDITIVTNNKESTLALIPELRNRLKNIGVTLHPNKFYCQHYKKGVEFLGHHIKMDRCYVNNRCKRNMMNKIDCYNKMVNLRNIDRFISTINSYLGQFKTANGYRIVCCALKRINPKWWQFVEYDKERICIRPKEEYSYNNRIINHFNLQHYDRKKRDPGKDQSSGI